MAQRVKNPPANAGDTGDSDLIPGSGGSPREGNGAPLQYYLLKNLTDRGAWWAILHRVTNNQIEAQDKPFLKVDGGDTKSLDYIFCS